MSDEPKRRHGSIASHVGSCLRSFKELFETGRLSRAQDLIAHSHHVRFRLWAGSLGAHRPGGSRSLDHRLRDSSSIRDYVKSLLIDLEGLLGHLEWHSQQLQEAVLDELDAELAQHLNNDTPQGAETDHDNVLESIGGVVDCLLRLSLVLSNPAPRDQFTAKIDDTLKFYIPWDIQHVRNKFPAVALGISDRLGKALTQRRQYFKYRKEHYERLRSGIDAPSGFETDKVGEETTVASSLPAYLKDDWNPDSANLREDTSAASETSYEPSNIDNDVLRVPRLPNSALDEPFLCPFCQTFVEVDSRRAWKSHVFHDLRPYVCVVDNCPTPHILYERRHEWIRHARDHWNAWMCPFGCQASSFSADQLDHHIRDNHADEAFQKEQGNLLATWECPPDSSKVPRMCPMCMETDIKTEKMYATHVGGHLEQLALFSLPDIASQDESESRYEVESGGSSKAGYETLSKGDPLLAGLWMELPPPFRVKLYELRDNDWFDRGTGFLRLGRIAFTHNHNTMHLKFDVSSEDSQENILEDEVPFDLGMQQGTLLVWTNDDGVDMALSFQEAEQCSAVWEFISVYTGHRRPT